MTEYIYELNKWSEFDQVTFVPFSKLKNDEAEIKHLFDHYSHAIHKSQIFSLMRRKSGFSRRLKGLEELIYFFEKSHCDFIYPIDVDGSFLMIKLNQNSNPTVYNKLVTLVGNQAQLIFNSEKAQYNV